MPKTVEKGTPDYAPQDLVIERVTRELVFAGDGTGQESQYGRIRIQSAGAVQQFGVLRFPYRDDIEHLDRLEIQVRKPDGRIVVTPDSNVQDLPAEVTREAPTYSSAREKQVPVKSLGVGDVLEWKSRTIRTKADIPGQFCLTHDFTKEHIVLEEQLRIIVPAGKYVQLSSPRLKPDVHEENGNKVYFWKTSWLEIPSQKEAKKTEEPRRPDVQLTTFKSWAEVGQWYRALEQLKIDATPAIREKAATLTAGLKTDAEKQRAIYQFVATKFRYISISFGDGRYQPHSADEVLANQYGDCKDKHTLFAALLRAAGIEAWPALIGAGLAFDPDVPSPAQFNHVITYIPHGASPVWLDTTPEVAPYGLLQQPLRDRQALVIPENGTPSLMTTAKEPPFPADEKVTVEAKLSAEGTLTGHFDISLRGDSEVNFRSLFHVTAPAQWSQIAQNISAGMGFGGTVRDLDVDNPSDLEEPFHYSYNYERKNYSDWENRRITPPFPMFVLLPFGDDDKPYEPTNFGVPGKTTYRARIELPPGYSVEIPGNTKLQTELADYFNSYSVEKGVLSAERLLVVKVPKLAPGQWDEYRKFAKAIAADTGRFLQLVRADTTSGSHVVSDVPEAAKLIQKAAQSLQSHDFNTARDALAQAERLNPGQTNLWMTYAYLYGMQKQNEKAIEALKKEVQYHPGNETVYRMLAGVQRQLGHKDDAIDTLRQLVKMAPQNADAAVEFAYVLFERKKYGEAIETLQAALSGAPNNTRLQASLLEALLRTGRKPEGLAILAKLREATLDSSTLNNAAYVLADTDTDLALAKELAEKAVADYENRLKEVTLPALTNDPLKLVNSLGATWDTIGWAAFRSGDLAAAEKYIHAAWILLQHAASADHLGQIYERQAKKPEAIHAYQLSLAVQSDSPETRARLEKLGGTFDDRPTLTRGKPAIPPRPSPTEELQQLRTVTLPDLAYRHGTAEFFLLFSAAGIEDVQFISGDDALKAAAGALRKIRYDMPFPDRGPEKIPRRGILSCSQYSKPNCMIVFLLPANTTNF